MPPRALSRHTFTRSFTDSTGQLVLSRAEPYRFREFADNIPHTVRGRQSLFTIAGQRYRVIDPIRACGLWWVVADFQPEPIHDPTLQLEDGRVLILLSPRRVLEEVFSEARRISES